MAEFRKHGVTYQLSSKNRSELYLGMIPVVNSKRCELPDDRRMIDELKRLERRRGRTGKDSIDHPAHLSDDLANSTAGAIDLVIAKAPMSKNAIPVGVGRGLGAELRQVFGPLAMDKPFPDSTFGPAPAEERPGQGCAEVYGFNFGDNSEDPMPGGYVSKTLSKKRFRSIE